MAPDANTQALLARDESARARALAVEGSFLVRAPGSGKTELLTQRVLALLATVDQPEGVVAITFTRKAAGEMRNRVLQALEWAQNPTAPEKPHQVITWQLARQILARDQARPLAQRWSLRENPTRLRMLTIDAFCAGIVRQAPLAAGFGVAPRLLEDTLERKQTLTRAVRATLAQAEKDPAMGQALLRLLSHRDNHLADLEALLVQLLEKRDQWMRHVGLGQPNTGRTQAGQPHAGQPQAPGSATQPDLPGLRADMEQALLHWRARALNRVRATAPVALTGALFALRFAGQYLARYQPDAKGACLAHLEALPRAEEADHPAWLALAEVFLTQEGQWRTPRGLNKKQGFPAKTEKIPDSEAHKATVANLLEEWGAAGTAEVFRQALVAVRNLPPAQLDPAQWEGLEALLTLLPHALEALEEAFAQAGGVDFTQSALGALAVLETRAQSTPNTPPTPETARRGEPGGGEQGADPGGGEGRISPETIGRTFEGKAGGGGATPGVGIQHLLVDEFQDTSHLQYRLLEALTAHWTPGSGNTLFLVGDPMQSIYRFREAEVGFFLRTWNHSRLGRVALETLSLTRNFRSSVGLVAWANQTFSQLFPAQDFAPTTQAVLEKGAVPFFPALAQGEPNPLVPWDAVQVEAVKNPQAEAKGVARRARQALALDPGHTVAVLVRARTHLVAVLEELRKEGIPFQAVEIQPLKDESVVADLLALTRCLLHPADRVAWLAVLRAPWCGLTLSDLDALLTPEAPATPDAPATSDLPATRKTPPTPDPETPNPGREGRPGVEGAENGLGGLGVGGGLGLGGGELGGGVLGGGRPGGGGVAWGWIQAAVNAPAGATELPLGVSVGLSMGPAVGLSVDGRRRLERLFQTLTPWVEGRARLPLRRRVEGAWLALGGPACIPPEQQAAAWETARAYLDLLEDAQPDGREITQETILGRMENLMAPPDTHPQAARLQVMTMHKAKGLEFDTVILPGLHRKTRAKDRPWLTLTELTRVEAPAGEEATDLLLALRHPKGGERDLHYDFLQGLSQDKENQESLRLFYVAATRAKAHLHLVAQLAPESQSPESQSPETPLPPHEHHPDEQNPGGARPPAPRPPAPRPPAPESLLGLTWPVMESAFLEGWETLDPPVLTAAAETGGGEPPLTPGIQYPNTQNPETQSPEQPPPGLLQRDYGSRPPTTWIRRVPADWRPPQPPPGVPLRAATLVVAENLAPENPAPEYPAPEYPAEYLEPEKRAPENQAPEPAEPPSPAPVFDWAGDAARHVGNVAHRWLARMAADLARGGESWTPTRLAAHRGQMETQLRQWGVSRAELPLATDRVITALANTLNDERGRWILHPHAQARSEWALTGVLPLGPSRVAEHPGAEHQREATQVVNKIIDRTFVDEQGVRWIIDYKTGTHEGGGLEHFLAEEKARYRPQLETYARLLALVEDRPVRLALYHPLLSAFTPWEAGQP